MRMQTRQDHIDPQVTKVTSCRYTGLVQWNRPIDVYFTDGSYACSASIHALSQQELPTLRTPDRDEAAWIREHAVDVAKTITVELCPSHEDVMMGYEWGQEGHLYSIGHEQTLALCLPRR